MMFGMGMFGFLFWIAVIALVIWGVAQITQSNRRQDTPGNQQLDSEAPLEILKKRYARGEITKEQYEEMKRDLLSS